MIWPLVVLNVIRMAGCREHALESRPNVPVDTWLTIQTTPSYPLPNRQVDDVYGIQIMNDGRAARTKNGVDAGRIQLSGQDISALQRLVDESRPVRDPAVPLDEALIFVDVYRNGGPIGTVFSKLDDDKATASRIYRLAQSCFANGKE
jgi:hypothetical protein